VPVSDNPALIPDAATVCQCNTVSKGAIVAVWRDGADSVAEVVAITRATTGCGSCQDAVCGLVDWLSSVDSVGPGRGAASDAAEPDWSQVEVAR
jgi:assimilatory nitrate reductase electron transfer subunit